MNFTQFKLNLRKIKKDNSTLNVAIVNFRLYNQLKKLADVTPAQPLLVIEGFTFYINPNNLDNKVYLASMQEIEDVDIIYDSKPHQPKLPYFEEEENEKYK